MVIQANDAFKYLPLIVHQIRHVSGILTAVRVTYAWISSYGSYSKIVHVTTIQLYSYRVN